MSLVLRSQRRRIFEYSNLVWTQIKETVLLIIVLTYISKFQADAVIAKTGGARTRTTFVVLVRGFISVEGPLKHLVRTKEDS